MKILSALLISTVTLCANGMDAAPQKWSDVKPVTINTRIDGTSEATQPMELRFLAADSDLAKTVLPLLGGYFVSTTVASCNGKTPAELGFTEATLEEHYTKRWDWLSQEFTAGKWTLAATFNSENTVLGSIFVRSDETDPQALVLGQLSRNTNEFVHEGFPRYPNLLTQTLRQLAGIAKGQQGCNRIVAAARTSHPTHSIMLGSNGFKVAASVRKFFDEEHYGDGYTYFELAL